VDVITATPAPGLGPPPACAPLVGVSPVGSASGESIPGVRVLRLPVPRMPGAGIAYTPALLGAVARALAAGAADGRPYDVAHAHASVIAPVAWAALWAARRRGTPCVFTAHSVLRASGLLLGAADRAGGWTRGPVLVTGVSGVVVDELRRRLPGARTAVLPNATDVAWWRAPARRGAAAGAAVPRREPGEVRLVTAMRFARKKRPLALVDLLAAAARAAPPGARVRLVAAGDGPLGPALARAARARGLADALVLPGWLPRAALRALYHDADAFVLPTVHESFGIAALEARAAGLPVLGRAGTGLAGFVGRGAARGGAPDGVLAPDDGALAAAAARLAADAPWRRALQAASRDRPPREFDWPAVVAAHEAAYDVVRAAAGHDARPAPRPAAARPDRRADARGDERREEWVDGRVRAGAAVASVPGVADRRGDGPPDRPADYPARYPADRRRPDAGA
jgi:glycosyltransferase involved in cell wall biosynthesis